MAKQPLSMRQISEILRLKHQAGLSVREIARSCGLPTSTVGDYLKRAEAAALSWPLPESLSEAQLLEQLLDGANGLPPTEGPKVLPDWQWLRATLVGPREFFCRQVVAINLVPKTGSWRHSGER